MTSIAILTATYPYFPAEHFLEEEMEYWSSYAHTINAKVTIMPMSALGNPRLAPPNIDVDLFLTKKSGLRYRLWYVMRALFSPVFWKEAVFVLQTQGIKPYCLAKALSATGHTLRIQLRLRKYIANHGKFDVIYCYWNDVQAFAAALLKRKHLVSCLVTRLHGFDLYEDARPHRYMPLKRQFLDDFDIFFPVSADGGRYLQNIYKIDPEKIVVSRLGVSLPQHCAPTAPDDTLTILSVAFCVPEKRIDKIIDALACLSQRKPELSIHWTHIGDGILLDELKEYSARKLSSSTIKYVFLEHLKNSDVKRYFESNPIDVFINTSDTEGIPVSIMEAMSYGIPVIAPNVGGIAELHSQESGELLAFQPTPSDIADAALRILPRVKDHAMRRAAQTKVSQEYSASKNYSAFIQQVLTLATAHASSGSRIDWSAWNNASGVADRETDIA